MTADDELTALRNQVGRLLDGRGIYECLPVLADLAAMCLAQVPPERRDEDLAFFVKLVLDRVEPNEKSFRRIRRRVSRTRH